MTARELEVLTLVASGASAKEIARVLEITSRTVESHINHLKLKTRSRNSAHLVAMALEEGLIDNPCHVTSVIAAGMVPVETKLRHGGKSVLSNGIVAIADNIPRQ
ncbi:response regulator transcription factor [Sphingopyxis sp. MG]|uniref:response regulator transcription factor n=1 Tax=Sphingopyxis sp. MG TaxID=1866325 RepID=UPI001F1BA4D0|nr:helix-turn-helix transcriptional regulator [Sphingopyxis sp. MG]